MVGKYLKIAALVILGFCTNSALAQQLEIEGGEVAGSISKKMGADGSTSARVLVFTNVKAKYTTNMGNFPPENIASGKHNGMIVDTLYFFNINPNDNSRTITVNAEGYSPAKIKVKLSPKKTFQYTIIDASGGSEYSQLLDSANQASSEHKYSAAAGFYKQALVADGAPSDLSPVHEYIEVMETCAKHLDYAKRCLIMAKKFKEEHSKGADNADIEKLKDYYEEALKSYEGIRSYMNDDKHDEMIGKIKSAISSLSKLKTTTTTTTVKSSSKKITGVVENAANTAQKLSGVKIYGMTSSGSKHPHYLTTTNSRGEFEIDLSPSQAKMYKLLLFDPKELKGFRKTKEIAISSSNNSKLRVKLYK